MFLRITSFLILIHIVVADQTHGFELPLPLQKLFSLSEDNIMAQYEKFLQKIEINESAPTNASINTTAISDTNIKVVKQNRLDYDIYASYVKSPFEEQHQDEESDFAYMIASQGPKENITESFWDMVARERVTKIVALTQTIGHHGLDSNQTPELHQYFPSHEMGLSEVETKDYSI